VVRRSAGSLMVTMIVAMSAAVTSSSSVASASTPITWLAAGDSYAAGAGLPNTTSPCAQGTGNKGRSSTWAVVAANDLRKAGYAIGTRAPDLVACTGAISDEFFHAHTGTVSGLLGDQHPLQWNPKMGRFDLVTFSFGGNDIGFESIIQHCLDHQGCPSDQAVRQKIHLLGSTGVYKGKELIPSYPTFLRHVAESAVVKGGNVVVMGYPEIVENPSLWSSDSSSCAGLSVSQVNTLRGWAGDLNATIGYAVSQANKQAPNGVHFTFIDVVTGQPQSKSAISLDDPNLFEPSSESHHELCSTGGEPWLNGLLRSELSRSFHPTQAGEIAMGNLAAEVIPRLTWPWSKGATGGVPSPPHSSAPSSTTVTPSSSSPVTPPISYTNTWNFTATTDVGGYSESGTISVGQVQKFEDGLVNDGVTAGATCTVDPQTDAVAPFKVTLTNTSNGFTTGLGASIAEDNAQGQGTSINWELGYAGGPQCTQSDNSLVLDCTSVSSGDSCSLSGWAIVTGYYTPDALDGNTAGLQAITLQALPEPFASEHLNTFAGPGGVLILGGSFTLVGATPQGLASTQP
jgi:hypothetical protein